MDKHHNVLVYLALPVCWLLYLFSLPLLFWYAYNPMDWVLNHFSSVIRDHAMVFYGVLALHDFALNLLLALPFAYGLIKLAGNNIIKPVLFAAIVVAFLVHRSDMSALATLDTPNQLHMILGMIGSLFILPLACVLIRRVRGSTAKSEQP
ncbi:hypothetical protein EXT46_07110 [Pseudoalteromonas sp. CO325X]|uniref:hypothetical protein n=1 Tax=Pseudoalteromonas sp. CO325X TaxID=1777262 RepID=UPI001022C8E2|nr:hypothetical protein [Pseudoalteromonas sp. CO325X]RZF83207.1 hypothetical protein EXT46_07110 [Pseudoalteromonas sp. CO325X]